ncbi:glycoside hydrolase family 3 N-terminal domain-containing protein [Chelatococcus asaccharovorans]|uniref:glycoside hydrolase family 3 N-terminal domain-containing protein n=1 Tax=Chelatococcus asaccharovorans TaxID=28210 RepID=UPI00224C7237|nr:glycoside hydrolase family 3 N-terminal domain-containing protein [Chelatococcus asaccharovorans]CAH1654378.1 Periplasmic beta-glucosidase [Chelatococcus asaccharovorans]CAH1694661.1 Periplasmic beta-glucosidase [Chelatococcus asaccharovorans]
MTHGRKIRILTAALLVAGIASAALAQTPVPGQPPSAPAPVVAQHAPERASARVEDLIARMTIAEKVGQLVLLSSNRAVTGPYTTPDVTGALERGELGGIFNTYDVAFTRQLQETAVKHTRLGIPLLFGFDVLHGHRTIFPVPLGQAASFDLKAIEGAERIAGREAAAAGINWVFAPMLDVTRDPRWGRIVEGAGESPWLGGQIGAARVRGFQGERLDADDSVAACVKHFGANGAVESGRDYTATSVSERALREIYLPPFKATVAAGVRCFMAAFNTFDGVPGVANRHLLTDILRKEWGFQGVVVSDFGAVEELVTHGIAADREEAAKRALTAGTDIEMQGEAFRRDLPRLVASGAVPMAVLDDAVRHVLTFKEELGLFDKPFGRMDEARERTALFAPAHRQAAIELAEKSLVLLKNDRETLPFSPDVRRIAVIGPLADDRADTLGPWAANGQPDDAITLAAGLRQVLPKAVVEVVSAGSVNGSSPEARAAAVAVARTADVVVLALGEKSTQSGEAASRTDLGLPGDQMELARDVLAVGRPTAVVLFHGRPLVLTPLVKDAPAILSAWFPGSMGGLAIARTLVGENEPRGRLPVTFPRAVGQIPIYHDHLRTGRPPTNPPRPYTASYLDEGTEPLFPFGYGLSYTDFGFSPPRMAPIVKAGEPIAVAVDVTNTGRRPGTALVQLYVNQPVAEISRPVKELRGFQHVALKPGETRTVTLSLTDADLAYWHQDGRWATDAGRFRVMTGANVADLQAAEFTLQN